jgi:hypothetical protein
MGGGYSVLMPEIQCRTSVLIRMFTQQKSQVTFGFCWVPLGLDLDDGKYLVLTRVVGDCRINDFSDEHKVFSTPRHIQMGSLHHTSGIAGLGGLLYLQYVHFINIKTTEKK